MKSSFKLSLLAVLMAVAGVSYAMGPMGGQCDMSGGMSGRNGMQQSRSGKMDPARMQARMDQRHAVLKTQLKLSADQEAAWTAFDAAHKVPGMMNKQRPDRAEMAKLTTPERIDKMKAMRAEHQAEADKRADSTKAFYAVLNAEQKKVFDSFAMNGPGKSGRQGQGQGRS